jgi:hypothetical protein
VFVSKTNKFSGTTIGVATGYWLDRMEFESWWGQNCLLFHIVQSGSGAHLAYYSVGTSGSFPRCKGAEAWSWPLASNLCWGKWNIEVYICSPIRLHVLVIS